MMIKGFVKLDRSILGHELLKDATAWKVFSVLAVLANRDGGLWMEKQEVRDLANVCRRSLKITLEKLVALKLIECHSTKIHLSIQILNYKNSGVKFKIAEYVEPEEEVVTKCDNVVAECDGIEVTTVSKCDAKQKHSLYSYILEREPISKKETKKPTRKKANRSKIDSLSSIELPKILSGPKTKEALQQWLDYKHNILGKQYFQYTFQNQVNSWAKEFKNPRQLVEAITLSINSQWSGVFLPKEEETIAGGSLYA